MMTKASETLRATAMGSLRTIAVALGIFAACSTKDPTSGPAASGDAGRGTTNVTSDDGTLSVSVPAGALPPGQTVTIAPATDVPPGNVGPAYELGPAGAVFTVPVALTFKVAGAAERNLVVATAVDGAWVPLDAQVLASDRVTALARHFSLFTLIVSTRTPISNQATGGALACKGGCEGTSIACAAQFGAPQAAGGCGIAEPAGWGAYEQDAHLICIESQAFGDASPAATGPCYPGIRKCAVTARASMSVTDTGCIFYFGLLDSPARGAAYDEFVGCVAATPVPKDLGPKCGGDAPSFAGAYALRTISGAGNSDGQPHASGFVEFWQEGDDVGALKLGPEASSVHVISTTFRAKLGPLVNGSRTATLFTDECTAVSCIRALTFTEKGLVMTEEVKAGTTYTDQITGVRLSTCPMGAPCASTEYCSAGSPSPKSAPRSCIPKQ